MCWKTNITFNASLNNNNNCSSYFSFITHYWRLRFYGNGNQAINALTQRNVYALTFRLVCWASEFIRLINVSNFNRNCQKLWKSREINRNDITLLCRKCSVHDRKAILNCKYQNVMAISNVWLNSFVCLF